MFQAERRSGGLWLSSDGWCLGELCQAEPGCPHSRLVLLEINENLLSNVSCDIDFPRVEQELGRLAEYVTTRGYLEAKHPDYFLCVHRARPDLLWDEPVAVLASAVERLSGGIDVSHNRYLVI